MNWDGEEYRDTVERLRHEIFGNGKPGLKADVDEIKLGLYGNKANQYLGVIENQKLIKSDVLELKKDMSDLSTFVKSVKPFLNPKLLTALFTLSVSACIKVLGADYVLAWFHKISLH